MSIGTENSKYSNEMTSRETLSQFGEIVSARRTATFTNRSRVGLWYSRRVLYVLNA